MGVKRDDRVSRESVYGAFSTLRIRSMDKIVSWERSLEVIEMDSEGNGRRAEPSTRDAAVAVLQNRGLRRNTYKNILNY